MSYRQKGMMYATAGMGAVDPGIDISHYGAPYAQMLGLGNSGDGLGMLFRYGAGLGWTPGPGQSPADDPRILSKYGKVRLTYKTAGPSGWGSGGASALAATKVFDAVKKQFPGHTVRKSSSTGWLSGGKIGVDVVLAQPMRFGEIKAKSKRVEIANPVASVHDGLRLTNAETEKLQGTLSTPEGPATPEEAAAQAYTGPEAPEPSGDGSEGGLLTQKVGGIPVWGVGVMGLGIIGGVAYLALRKKKPAAVAANRRRRRRRSSKKRRPARRRRRSSRR